MPTLSCRYLETLYFKCLVQRYLLAFGKQISIAFTCAFLSSLPMLMFSFKLKSESNVSSSLEEFAMVSVLLSQ